MKLSPASYRFAVLALYALFLLYLCLFPNSRADRFLLLAGYSGLGGLAVCFYPALQILIRCRKRAQRVVLYLLFPFVLSTVTYFFGLVADDVYMAGRTDYPVFPMGLPWWESVAVLLLMYNAVLWMWTVSIAWLFGEWLFAEG